MTASHTGNAADEFVVDMDPAATLANTATSIDTIESCALIILDGVTNADEDSADTVLMDLMVRQLPPFVDNAPLGGAAGPEDTGGFLAWASTVGYPTPEITVASKVATSTDANTGVLIAQAAGSSPLDASDAVPDNDGAFSGAVAEVAPSPETGPGLESGDGRLITLGLQGNSGNGVFPITLSGSATIELNGESNPPHATTDGVVAIDDPNVGGAGDVVCPVEADLKLISQVPTFPASITVSQDEPLTLDKEIHNNGPNASVPVQVTKTYTLPPDCTVNGLGPGGVQVIGPVPAGTADQSIALPFQEIDTIHCTQPSDHLIEVENCVSAVDPLTVDPDTSNNCIVTPINFAATAEADVKVTQAITGLPAAKGVVPLPNGDPPLIVDQPLNFDVEKTLHNNGPFGPVDVQFAKVGFVDMTLGGLIPLGGNNGAGASCNVVPGVSPGGANLPVSAATPVVENWTVTCDRNGLGIDDDGDTFIDEEICGNGVDDDLDTLVDEDCAFLLPTVCVNNDVDITTLHVTDPAQQGSVVDAQLHDASALSCVTFLLERDFTPALAANQDQDDSPADLPSSTPPDDGDCLLTQPCEQTVFYSYGGIDDDGDGLLDEDPIDGLDNDNDTLVDEDPGACTPNTPSPTPAGGCQPVAGVVVTVPGAKVAVPAGLSDYNYYITRGALDPFNGTTPNGTVAAELDFAVTLKIGAGNSPCNAPLAGQLPLLDGALPAVEIAANGIDDDGDGTIDEPATTMNLGPFPGEGPNADPSVLAALPDPNQWPEGLEQDPVVAAINASGAVIWARYTGFEGGTGTPVNLLVFNAGTTGWLHVTVLGNPAAPPDPNAAQLCTPVSVTQGYLGETGADDVGSGDGGAKGVDGAGRDLRTCETIKGGTVFPADFHLIAASFTRADTGQQSLLVDGLRCTADSDTSVTKSDNLAVNAPADLTHTETIDITVTNGTVPGDVDVSVSLIGPAVCDPQLIPEAGDANTSPDVLTGPTVAGSQQASLLEWQELAMAANEVRIVSRDYTVNCPLGGPYELQVVVNADTPFPDPDLSNNQDENHPVITVDDDDADDDTVVNSVDNCPFDANPNQTDTDGDGEGDVCDDDDDDDGIPDPQDACPLAAEDFDGIDDADGCPDTDAGISFVNKDVSYDVNASENVSKSVSIGIANQGNIVADLELTLLLKSDVGVCEAHWVPQTGDGVVDEVIGSQIHSLLVIVEEDVLPGEVRIINRDYTVHCFNKSFHDNAVRFEAGVVPVWPVAEEDVGGAKPNVQKQNIDITVYEIADVKKLGIVVPDPTFNVSEDEIVTVRSVFHNNGPFGPVTVTDSISGSAPQDCTNVQTSGTNPTDVILPVSITVTLDQDFTMHCTEPSNHTFCWSDSIEIASSELHVTDPNPGNNSAELCIVNTVVAQFDAKITGVSVVSLNAQPDVGQNFNVEVTATAHNNGPFTPLTGTVVVDLSVPPDCTRVPAGSQSEDVNLPQSTAVDVTKLWLVNCSEPSNHQMDGSAVLTTDSILHVNDLDTENNDGAGMTNVAVFSSAEKQITSLEGQQEPAFVDLDGLAGVEDRLAADPGDANNDSASVAAVPAAEGVSYEFFSELETLAVTDTPTYGVTLSYAGTCVGLSADDVFDEPPETAGTVNVVKRPFTATLDVGQEDCTVDITADLGGATLHLTQEPDIAVASILLCRDNDEDGVSDSTNVNCGPIDNCPDDFNPGQEDTDGDGIGDVCDDTPNHDDGVKYCLKFGPAPINLSDNDGAYLWVLCEIGNFSGHDDFVIITDAADIEAGIDAVLPEGCDSTVSLLIPGRTDFVIFDGEQKFVLYRGNIECHFPAVEDTLAISITVEIDHQLHPVQPDGDDTNGSNDSVTVNQNIIIGPPPPP